MKIKLGDYVHFIKGYPGVPRWYAIPRDLVIEWDKTFYYRFL